MYIYSTAHRQRAIQMQREKDNAEWEGRRYAEEKEVALKESLQQMEKQMGKEFEMWRQRQDSILEARLREQERLLTVGLRREAAQLGRKLERLRSTHRQKASSQPGYCAIL